MGGAATGKSIESCSGKRKIGSFVNIWHDIGGEVFALDDETILIEDFTYDGQGPDAFFLAGTSGWRSGAETSLSTLATSTSTSEPSMLTSSTTSRSTFEPSLNIDINVKIDV